MKDFTKFHFTGQKPQEEIMLVLHRHWFDILSQFFFIFILVFILIGTYGYVPVVFPQLGSGDFRSVFLFFESLFFMFLWILSFIIWVDYYFDVWIVTRERIVNIEQKGLFSRETSEVELEKIQDVSTDIIGVIPTFLDYGDLQVQTAAEQEKFIFHNIPNPNAVKDLLMNLQKNRMKQEDTEFSQLLSKKIHHDDIA